MASPASSGEKQRVTVGLTQSGAENMAALMDTDWFEDEVDAYRLAIAVAIAQPKSSPVPDTSGNKKTKFNIGTLDPDGRVRTLVSAFSEEGKERPYETAERLAIAGLAYLRKRIVDEGVLLSDVIDGGLDSETDA